MIALKPCVHVFREFILPYARVRESSAPDETLLEFLQSTYEAAADLGAGPWTRFARVTVPLSLPGAIASFFMVFIPTVGEYVTPLLVGGSSGSMYGNIIQDFFTKAVNWPLGSALAILMLLVTVALLTVAVRVIDLRRLGTTA